MTTCNSMSQWALKGSGHVALGGRPLPLTCLPSPTLPHLPSHDRIFPFSVPGFKENTPSAKQRGCPSCGQAFSILMSLQAEREVRRLPGHFWQSATSAHRLPPQMPVGQMGFNHGLSLLKLFTRLI